VWLGSGSIRVAGFSLPHGWYYSMVYLRVLLDLCMVVDTTLRRLGCHLLGSWVGWVIPTVRTKLIFPHIGYARGT